MESDLDATKILYKSGFSIEKEIWTTHMDFLSLAGERGYLSGIQLLGSTI
jgi:hypothetical protein